MKFSLKFIVLFFFIILACSKDDEAEVDKSNESKLLRFSIKELDAEFTISSNNLVEANLISEINLTNLTSVFSISPKAKAYISSNLQTSGYSKNDFSNQINFIVEAENGSKTTYVISVNFEAKIKSFKIIELPNTQFVFDNLSMNAKVPFGTNLSSLTAQFEIAKNSNLFIQTTEQVSGQTKNDFNSPIIYLLKRNGIVEKQYTVTISKEENESPVANAGSNKLILIPSGSTKGAVNLDASNSSDKEGEISSFIWKNGSTTVATTEKATIDLAIGNHIIVLTVTDSAGSISTAEINIEIRVQGEYLPIDSNATNSTKKLYKNIANLANSNQFAFGQEFPLSFKLNGLSTDLNSSDCKDVTGDHPAVFGIDPHYMLYKTSDQKQLHINEAKAAYNNGSIVTFDFHQQSKTDHKIYMNDISTLSDKSLMFDIVNDKNNSRAWFYAELDQVINIINNDLGFPVVFRLFHEMDGDWFWWGSKATNHSTQLYVDFYRLATNYIKNKTDLVLFGWTPNQQLNVSYYPGDAYVDVVGLDIYNPISSNLKSNLIELSTFAYNHGKVAVLSETGKNDYVNLSPKFWTSTVLSAIQNGGSEIRIAWVLAWFNATWKSSQSDLFIPNSSSSSTVKNDFIEFKNSSTTLFQQEIKALNVYN